MTAVLPGRAAVFAQSPPDDVVCLGVSSDSTTQAVQASSVIAIARVTSVEPGSRATLVPEALLKGATASSEIALDYPATAPTSGCELATLTEGDRIFVFLAGKDGHPYWPSDHQVFRIEPDGTAVQQGDTGWREVTEQGLASIVRGQTGQYFVPAASRDEGAGMDWGSTILPVGLALLAIFGVSLAMMRVWHRIDPS